MAFISYDSTHAATSEAHGHAVVAKMGFALFQ